MYFREGKNGQKHGISGTSGLLSCSSTKQAGYIHHISVALYLIYVQDAFRILRRFLLCDLLSFMPQSRTVGNTIIYISLLCI